MMLHRDIELVEEAKVVRKRTKAYNRIAAANFNDERARLTPRQVLFYRTLMEISQQLGSNYIPVDFSTPTQGAFYLDRGCIKIAVHAGFLKPLKNDDSGTVSEIELAWDATGVWVAK